MRVWKRSVVAAAVTAALFAGAACLSSDDAEERAFPDVLLEGRATDRALGTVIEVTPEEDLALGPVIVSPSNNAVLPPDPIITFAWTPEGATASRSRWNAPRGAALSHADAPERLPLLSIPSGRPHVTLPPWLAELIGPERSAVAARAPLSGMGYFLVFATPEQPALLRVFTTETSYTPDAKAWKILRSAGTWTELTVSRAAFLHDSRLPATGPVTGEHVEFCIEAH